MKRTHIACAALFLAILFFSLSASADGSVFVSNVDELYAAVNDPANAGAVVVLAPGTYTLSATDGTGSPRPNGGRLELQQDMSLYGVDGDRSAVIIDGSSLPSTSVKGTGIVRTGRGSNSVQWLTISGNPRAASSINTDLPGNASTSLMVAHVTTGNSVRGVDIRNNGLANAGRRLEAEIDDSDFSSLPATSLTEPIRIANLSTDAGQIGVALNGNRAHGGRFGCLVANDSSSFGTIDVRSNGDTFDENALGCLLAAGINTGATETANSNSVTFEAHGSRFIDNTAAGLHNFNGGGGIAAVAADVEAPAAPESASANTLAVRLWGCTFGGNQNVDFEAWGARAMNLPAGTAGTDDTTTIDLHGVSKFVNVVAVDSTPADPTGTDTVTVNR